MTTQKGQEREREKESQLNAFINPIPILNLFAFNLNEKVVDILCITDTKWDFPNYEF